MGYCVYKHTFPNNKIYIGITGKEPEIRWDKGRGYAGHSYMARAIIGYGWDNIKHEILFNDLSLEEAEKIEVELIKKYQSNNPKFGYNVAAGGNMASVNSGMRKIVRINKNLSKNNFLQIDKEELLQASVSLSPSALKMYLHFADNQDGNTFVLNIRELRKELGVSERTERNARNELIEKGYLVCTQDNTYDFYTTPNIEVIKS